MQIPILSGIKADTAPGWRAAYPRNLVVVPVEQGISKGYLTSADGIEQFATGQGVDRGGIEWGGVCYRVSGTKLIRVSSAGGITVLGDVGPGGFCQFDYSFDRLAINSGSRLYYLQGSTLTQVTDGDLGSVNSVIWVDGYFMTTDGQYLVVTELTNPAAVDPLKYGSSEIDPDPVLGLAKLRGEVYALNRHSIEVFSNVGGTGFPFQRVEGAVIPKGVIGSRAYCHFADTVAFLGSGRNEAPGVYLVGSGSAQPVSTREIDQILEGYTESQLESAVLESRTYRKQALLLVHLPDQTLVYDGFASVAAGEAVWYTFASSTSGTGQYRAIGHVWCYDRWIVGDPTSNKIGVLTEDVETHYGDSVGWEFSTLCVYNNGNGGIIHDLELVALPGYAPFGDNPVIMTSYSVDGRNWSVERAVSCGRFGQTDKRIIWLQQGMFRHWRIQKFRGVDTGRVAFARLEANVEPLGV